MSLPRAIFLIFFSILLQLISSPSFSTPPIDFSFDPSITVTPSIRFSSSGPLTIDLTGSNDFLPELLILKIVTSDIKCSSDNCFAHITYDGNEIWKKQIFTSLSQEVFTTSIVIRTPGLHSVTISPSNNLKWTIKHISINKREFPQQSRGISYSPFRNRQSPGGLEPSMAELDYDLEMLSHVSQSIRTYSSTGIQQNIPKLAKKRGLSVYAGAWINNEYSDNEEVQNLVQIAKEGLADNLVVGSEFLFRCLKHKTIPGSLTSKDYPGDCANYLFDRIDAVRTLTEGKIPISTGILYGEWNVPSWQGDGENKSRDDLVNSLLSRIDYLLVHVYPYHNQNCLEEKGGKCNKGAAKEHYKTQLMAIAEKIKAYPNVKRIVLGEVGWPSGGATNGGAVPGLHNQAVHYRLLSEVLKDSELLTKYPILKDSTFLYFSAFDESWKARTEASNNTGAQWGFSYADRSAKHNFFGVLVNPDDFEIRQSSYRDEQTTYVKPNGILDSRYHLVQVYGDSSYRNTNFFADDYDGLVSTLEARLVFPRFSQIFDTKIPLPDPYIEGSWTRLKDIDWEDRNTYGVGVEWRPFANLVNNGGDYSYSSTPSEELLSPLRFYAEYLRSNYIYDDPTFSWRPRHDERYGAEFYQEYQQYDNRLFWGELWADASWRKTNFFIDDFESWTFAIVPKVGIKIPKDNELSVMPYLTLPLSVTERPDFWQNRIESGIGIRIMPFRWHRGSHFDVIAKKLKIYAEYLKVISYLDEDAPDATPDSDFRIGINFTLNWE